MDLAELAAFPQNTVMQLLRSAILRYHSKANLYFGLARLICPHFFEHLIFYDVAFHRNNASLLCLAIDGGFVDPQTVVDLLSIPKNNPCEQFSSDPEKERLGQLEKGKSDHSDIMKANNWKVFREARASKVFFHDDFSGATAVQESIFSAILDDDIESLKKALANAGDDFEIDGHFGYASMVEEEGGDSYLGCAARYNAIKCFKHLLLNGACIDSASDAGWTAIQAASYSGNEEMIQMLLEKGAGIEGCLVAAIMGHQTKVINWLINERHVRPEKEYIDCSAAFAALYVGNWTAITRFVDSANPCDLTRMVTDDFGLDVTAFLNEHGKLDKEELRRIVNPTFGSAHIGDEVRDYLIGQGYDFSRPGNQPSFDVYLSELSQTSALELPDDDSDGWL